MCLFFSVLQMTARHEAGHFDNISQWFPCLGKEFTFDTLFLELSKKEGEAIIKVRENGRMIGTLYSICSEEERDQKKVLDMDPFRMLEEANPELNEALKELSTKMEEALKSFPNGAFMRLDTRSPKDAALKSSYVRELIKEQIESKPHNDPFSIECATDDGIIYWSCISKSCKVDSAQQALELLTGSNRVQEDLKLGFLAHDHAVQLVFREWEDIHPEYEFRVFVVHNEITAMTQYHSGLYVPEMAKNKEKVQDLILAEFNRVKDKVKAPESTYTIDFVITENLDAARIVEINDPPPTAGTSLFDWDDEEDQGLLLHGPLSFRMITEPLTWEQQQQKSSMHLPLVEYMDELRGRTPREEKPSCIIC